MSNVDWIIHLVADGVACEECGKVEDSFIPYMCNAHTHGMERYNHKDFQMVINAGAKEIGRILNTFGMKVQAGEQFHDGQYVYGIYEDCAVRLQEFDEGGRKVLRVVIPDGNNAFPEEAMCKEPYSFQKLKTEDLQLQKIKS